MAMTLGFFKELGAFKQQAQTYFKTGRKLLDFDLNYLKNEGARLLKTYAPALGLLLGGLACLLAVMLLTLMLLVQILSLWLNPWIASLLLLAVLLSAGLALSSRGLTKLKQGLAEVRLLIDKLKQDLRAVEPD